MRRSDLTLFFLSAAAGAIDAVSFIAFGVFTSAMTGNTALLGIAAARQNVRLAINAGTSLAAYLLGAVASTPFAGHGKGRIRPVLALEVVALAGFAGLAITQGVGHPGPGIRTAIIALGAFGMGAQAVAARSVDAPGIVTVVFTSTITAIAEAAGRFVFRHEQGKPLETRRQLAAYGCYLGGALAGGLVSRVGYGSLVPVACAAAALLVQCNRRPSS